MRYCMLVVAALLLSLPAYAGNNPSANDQPNEKANVSLEDNGYSISGGTNRDKQIQTKFERVGVSFDPISIDDKVKSLRSSLYFYLWLKKNNIDPAMKITAVYTGRPLREVVQELLPGMKVKFVGVNENETVGEMKATNADLEAVCRHLDNASAVFFEFSPEGLIIKANP